MATEKSTDNETASQQTSGDDIQVVETASPNGMDTRTPRSPFGDLFDSFPSIFGHRWPDVFAGVPGFEPMKVEEEVDDGSYVIRAEIPGVDPDEGIDISVDSDRLTISAVREKRTEADESNDFRSEFRYGSFRRSMTLPRGAETDNIKATYIDGILEVSVPIDSEEPIGKKIPVERAS